MRTQPFKTLMALCFSLALFGALDRAAAQCTPPTISTQPQDRTVNPGGTFNLGVTAAGTSPFTYQWFQDGSRILNATNRTYNKTGAQPSDSGIYFVAVSNACGFVNSANVLVTVTVPPYTLVPLTNHAWRYNQSGADLGTAWREITYDDAAWPSGLGVFAFEDNATVVALRRTTLSLTNPAGQRVITYYFRTHFTLTNDPATVTLVSSNIIDDGVIVYLNGEEIYRNNMPNGTVNSTTPATGGPAEGTFAVATIPANRLVQGDNVLAAEVHQVNATSSDVVFGMAVHVTFPPPTRLVITNQPQSITVEETKPTTFTVGVQGFPQYFQWYRNGVAISNATRNPFTIGLTTTADAGQYYVVVTNLISTVTSAVVTLTVRADTNAPTLVEADGTLNLTNVLVSFSEAITAATATNVANYRITNTVGGAALTISRAVLQDGTNVLLSTSARTPGQNYILVVNRLRDLTPTGNMIATNSSIPVRSLSVLVAMNAGWKFYDPYPPFDEANLGTAWKEFTYDTSGWGDGAAVFYNGAAQEDVPAPVNTLLSQTPTFTSYFRNTFNFQGSLGGLRFLLTHIVDDGAVFYLNGTEIFRFNMPAGTPDYLTPATPEVTDVSRVGPIEVPAGALRQGANVLAVELHQTSAPNADKAFGVLLEAGIQSFIVGPVVITGGPNDVTVVEGETATFQVVQAGGSTFQWQQNSNNIAGATNGTYSIPFVPATMNGFRFRVAVSNSTSGLVSSNATLRVLSDTNPPALLSAFANEDNSFTLSFSERITAATAGALANYIVSNAAGTRLTVSSAVLTNGTNVILRFASYTPGAYTVHVSGLRDMSTTGNFILPSLATVGFNLLVPIDAQWKYNESGADLGTAWQTLNYNDSQAGWSNGAALHYIEGAALPAPKNTPISSLNGTDGSFRFTVYFRKKVNLPVTSSNLIYTLRHVIDDGLVIYANTNEFYRFNMPAGVPAYNSPAGPAIGDAVFQGPFTFTNLLVAGTNILAAEVHQNAAGSSDIVFGAELSASIPSIVTVLTNPVCQPTTWIAPVLRYQRVGTNVQLSWTNPVTNSCGSNAVFTLQQSLMLTNPAGAIPWVNVTTVSPYTAITTNSARFFRLCKP